MEYNAVTDFSATNNPDGVWEYLAGGALMTTQQSTLGLVGWNNGLSFPVGAFLWQNPTSATIQVGSLTFRADHLHLDPQSVATLRFALPHPLRESSTLLAILSAMTCISMLTR